MPRDLESERASVSDKAALSGMPPLTKSPAVDDNADPGDPGDKLMKDMQKGQQRDQLHPIVQTLNPSYLDSCVKLEDATFPPEQRGSREKFEYRLTVCGELCLGLFTTSKSPEETHSSTVSAVHIVDSHSPERKEVLLGQICATKTRNTLVSDDDMKVPENWRQNSKTDAASTIGHQEDGRTIAIHSLAVDPEYQGRGLGKTLLKAYINRIQTAGIADRISILTYERLVPFYESVGFENKGASKAQYGGGGWVDMVLEFSKPDQK